MNDSLLIPGIFKQKRAAEKLVKESRADLDFFLFLCASVLITTLGLLIDNPIIIVGAMLVAPILFPILALGLGVVTASVNAMRRALFILIEAVAIGVVIAFFTSLLFNSGSVEMTEQLRLLTRPNLFVFFLTSFAAGIVASFSWVTQDTAMSFPGVAITVSLVPPLSAIGISLALLSQELLIGSVMLFLVNLLGVVLASVVVFSVFGFRKARSWQDERIRKEEEKITKQPTDLEKEALKNDS